MKDSQKLKTKKRLFRRKKGNSKKPEKKGVIFSATTSKASPAISFFKKSENNFQLIIIPLILLVILAAVSLFNSQTDRSIEKQAILQDESSIVMAPYPVIVEGLVPQLSAKAAIVTEASSQTILFSKNPELRFSMASTVKIMTALVALDYYKSDSILTVKSVGKEDSALKLQRGESFYFIDLLYALLLPSSNDAALTLADNYPGGKEAFIAKMNEKGKVLHLADTHFSDPVGLNDDGNYTTVIDLSRLSVAAIKNKEFSKITATPKKIISNKSGTRQYQLENLNKLLGINGVNGIKTGTTQGAGEVLVTSAVIDGHTYIIVVMNSEDRFLDTSKLLNFIVDRVQYVAPSFPQDSF